MPLTLYSLPGFAAELGTTPQALNVIYRRKKLPEPFALVDGRPAWTIEQIEEYKATPRKRGRRWPEKELTKEKIAEAFGLPEIVFDDPELEEAYKEYVKMNTR